MNNKNWLKGGLLLCVSAGLMACQTADVPWQETHPEKATSHWNKAVDTSGMKPGCFYPRQVESWDGVNNVDLIVYVPNKLNAYLVTIGSPVIGLGKDYAISFEGNGGRICGKPNEKMLINRDKGLAYSVLDVRRLTEADLERLLAPAPARPKQDGAEDMAGDFDASL